MAKIIQQAIVAALFMVGAASAESSILDDIPVPYHPSPALPHAPPPYPVRHYKEKGIPYSFSYGIKDEYVGADYGQEEKSDGDIVQGTYYVALPDGRLQTVKYQADHVVGYVADVEYKGDAQHPIVYGPVVTFRPTYTPPRAPTAVPTEEEPPTTSTPYTEDA